MADQLHYRPVKALKVTILLLMGGLMLAQGVLLYFEFLNLNYILQMKNGVQFPQAELLANDRKMIVAGLVFTALNIPTAIVFLCILFRLRKNVEALGSRNLSNSAGWTVGYFFIPILNLFRPFQAVRDIWKASRPAVGRWQDNPTSPILGVWWFLWITTGLVNYVVSIMGASAQTIEDFLASAILTIVVSMMTIALITVATWMLVRLMQMQDEKFQLYGEQSGMRFTCAGCGETIPYQAGTERCPLCGETLVTDFVPEAESQQDAKAAPPALG